MKKTLIATSAIVGLALILAVLVRASFQDEVEKLYAPVVFEKESRNQNIYVGRKGGVTVMFAGSLQVRNNAVKDDAPYEHLLEYTALLSMAMGYVDTPRSVCVIGLAGGAVPTYFRKYYPDLRIRNVEFDEVMPQVARRFFFYREDENMRTVIEDGRVFLAQNTEQYDLIILDAFNGHSIPFHLTTLEFLKLVKSRLKPNGVVAANTFRIKDLSERVAATFHNVFGRFDVFDARQAKNRIIIAQNREGGVQFLTRQQGLERMQQWQDEKNFTELHFPALFAATYKGMPEITTGTPVLTDDYAPVNVLVARALEE